MKEKTREIKREKEETYLDARGFVIKIWSIHKEIFHLLLRFLGPINLLDRRLKLDII